MKIVQKLLATTGALLCINAALANDSTGTVSTSGIEYLKSKDIRMVSEDLYISEKIIRVEYEFHNDTDHDVTETILFPLPAIPPQVDGDFAHTEDLIKTFHVWTNGQEVQTQAHSFGFWQGKDVTHALLGCDLSQQEIAYAYYYGVNPYNSDREKRFDECTQKLLADKALKSQPETLWDSQVVYSWQQTFPAHTSIKVKHEYQPLLGGSVAGIMRDDKYGLGNELQKTYCFDKTFWKKMSATENIYYPYYLNLGYILTTGANWAKPIERFHLTIEKPKDALMSLCWDESLIKKSDTRFEAVKNNFTPKRDIEIIFAMPSRYE